jgi:hypothetical protein
MAFGGYYHRRRYGMTYKQKKLMRRGKRAIRRVNSLRKYLIENNGGRGSAGNINWFGADRASSNDFQKKMRYFANYRGKGGYWDDLKGAYDSYLKPALQSIVPKGTLQAAGGTLGGLAGSYLGMPTAGAMGGSALGAGLSNYLGWGAYSNPVAKNQLIAGGPEGPVTVNASSPEGDLFFSHREFLSNVIVTGSAGTSSAFQLMSFPLNPGLMGSFPFLSQIAQNFVMYEFHGLIFEYKPTSGESGASNNSLGKVIMATSYDPDSPNFVNSVQMENYDYAQSTKPSCGQLHGVETANHQQFANMTYIRTGASSRDKIFTDIGTFQIATEGVPLGTSTSVIIGELWVTYRVKLSRANIYGSYLCLNSGTDVHFGSTYSGGSWIGSATTAELPSQWNASSFTNPASSTTSQLFAPKTSNTIGCVVKGTGTTTFTITFPPNIVTGQFLIMVWDNQASAGIRALILTATSLCAIAPFTPRDVSTNYFACNATSTETPCSVGTFVTVNAPGNSQAVVTCTATSGAILSTTRHYVTIQCINYAASQLN